MAKRNYTHVQALLPEIMAMLAEGKTQREVAEHFGFKDKYVVKGLLKRQRKQLRMLEVGLVPRPQGRPEKDAALAGLIVQQRERSFGTYGCRRMWLWLKSRNIFCNPKTVLRVMRKYNLLSEIRRRRKWQQMGQQLHKYENLLNRDFHADRPNCKLVTDISYIHTKQGTLYLSMIRDLYDNSIVAYKTGTQQTANLVLDTIRLAVKREKKRVAAELQLHSDQGAQYASQAYFELTKNTALRRQCQDGGTRMTMRWRKTFSQFSKRSVFTGVSRPRSRRRTR